MRRGLMMIGNFDIKGKLIELGVYDDVDGKVEIVKNLGLGVVCFKVENKGFGLASIDDGCEILLNPNFKRIVQAGEDIVVLENMRGFLGAYDFKDCKKLVPCRFDFVELNVLHAENEFADYIDFYEGVNSYTLMVEPERKFFFLNPHISTRMLALLEKKPELFLNMKSVYFRDVKGCYSKSNVNQCFNSLNKGLENKAQNLIGEGMSENVAYKKVNGLYKKIEEKVKNENLGVFVFKGSLANENRFNIKTN